VSQRWSYFGYLVFTHVKTLPTGETIPVQSLGRVLDVLALFTSERSELSLSEIAELLDWPLPTVHRATSTLLDREFLARDPQTKRFRLGLGVARLVAPLLDRLGLPDLARPQLRALADETGETVNLAVLDGADVLYLLSHPGRFHLRVQATPGMHLPAHCTALGKCMLAQLDPEEARRRLGPEPYAALTSATVRTWAALEPQLEAARANGYALSVGEYESGLLACAVPVPTRVGLSAAINVAASANRVSPEGLVKRIAPRLEAAAAVIARAETLKAGGA
jgi:IclR family acetate operon transcriptional repressor